MTELVLDNLVFDLQSHGGITSIWEPILAAIAASEMNLSVVQSMGHEGRVQHLGIGKTEVITERGTLWQRRFRSVAVPENTRVFHSSYFRVAQRARVKNIVTVHDCIAEKFDKGLRRFLHVAQKKRALRRADRVVAVSQNTKQDLLSLYPWLSEDKIDVIYNGVNTDFFSPSDAPKNKVLLYVGGRNVHKNFALALQLLASAAANGLTLDVCGGGAFSNSEQALIAELGLEKRVRSRGALSPCELRGAYQTAHALVYPSFYEGFGIPPVEAMACGCPVLAANRSCLPEITGDAALLFDPGDLEAATGALENLEKQRQSLIEKGFIRAAGFSQKNMIKNYMALYRTLLVANP